MTAIAPSHGLDRMVPSGFAIARIRGQDCPWLFRVGSAKRRSRRREEKGKKRGRESLFGSAANNVKPKTHLQREIKATDRQIYKLFLNSMG